MKERPILFSGAMVRAILAGEKTQTRRTVRLNDSGRAFKAKRNWHLNDPNAVKACPYGQPGDRLWVRETHIPKASGTIYRADFDDIEAAGLKGMYGGWKPSIFMRREFSRITLEVTAIRAEQLQDITPEDALAEGITSSADGSYVYDFRQLWDSINGKTHPWSGNPWVWVVEFRQLEGGES